MEGNAMESQSVTKSTTAGGLCTKDHTRLVQESTTMENPCLEHNNAKQDTFSDSESVNFRGSHDSNMFGSDFVRVDREEPLFKHIEQRFLSDLDGFGLQTQVVSIHKNCCSSSYWQGKLKAFQSYIKSHQEMGSYIKSHQEMGNGDANLKQGWFTASKAQIVALLSRGHFIEATNNGIYGLGVYLSPHHLTVDCMQSSLPDEDGMRHMVLCRVIMGHMEVIRPISKQNCSSSNEYHSGVDDLLSPTKYIIWNCHMNSHIFPVFVISFKSSNTNLTNNVVVSSPCKNPRSPWIPLPTLIDALSKVLPEYNMKLLRKHHHSFTEKRITREEIIKKIRDIAGDKLLVQMIKSYRNKLYGSKGRSPDNKNHEHGFVATVIKQEK